MKSELMPELRFLYQLFRDCPEGGLVTWEQIDEAAKMDVRDEGKRGWVASSINRVGREFGSVFQSVMGAGYRRLTADEIAPIASTKGKRKVANAAKKWGEDLSKVSYEKLSDTGKVGYQRSYTQLGIVQAATSNELLLKVQGSMKISNSFKPSKEDVMRAIASGVS